MNHVAFNEQTVILGLTPYTIRTHICNNFIIYAKYYIHKCRQQNQRPELLDFLFYYKAIIKTEKERYYLIRKPLIFDQIFGQMLNSL